MIEYPNVHPIIGSIVSSKFATLYELQTVYGLQDAMDIMEIINVNNHNQRAIRKWQQSKN